MSLIIDYPLIGGISDLASYKHVVGQARGTQNIEGCIISSLVDARCISNTSIYVCMVHRGLIDK